MRRPKKIGSSDDFPYKEEYKGEEEPETSNVGRKYTVFWWGNCALVILIYAVIICLIWLAYRYLLPLLQ